jgi:hypothetical protein
MQGSLRGPILLPSQEINKGRIWHFKNEIFCIMRKTLSAALLFFIIGFIWGTVSGHYEIFPFSIIKEIKYYITELIPETTPKKRQYRPEARFFTSTAGRREVACPAEDFAAFVALGQSNAANSLSSFGEVDPGVAAYQFYDGKCYFMEDPTIGSTGDRGSLWTEFAQDLSRTSGRSVVFVTSAVEASAVTDWLNPKSGYFGRAAQQIRQAIAAGLAPRFVLWHQGETDASLNTDPLEYTAMLKTLIERIDQLFEPGAEPTWVIFQASVCRRLPDGSPQITDAQRNVAKEHKRVALGPNTDSLGFRYRHDECHFNANGKARIIEDLKRIILDLGGFDEQQN